MNRQMISYTTDTAGAASVLGSAVLAKLYAVEYRPGDTDTGATVTLTCESDTSKPLLTKASAGTSNTWFYPRDLVHDVANGAALIGMAGGDRVLPIMHGKPKVTIASGGATKSGSVIFYYEE